MDHDLPDRPPVRPLRVGNRERQRAVDALTHHFSVGRLTLAELEERMALALAARTDVDLTAVVEDLPPWAADDGHGLDPWALPTQVALFVVGNVLLVLLWLATREPDPGPTDAGAGSVWPVWVALSWALALGAYAALRGRSAPAAPQRI